MSFTKYLLPIFLQFFAFRKNDDGLATHTSLVNAVTTTLKKEVSALILKIAFCLVATGVLIYSLVVLGQHLHAYLLLYDNGPMLAVISFSVLALICVFVIVKLFYQKPIEPDFEASALKDKVGFSLEKIYASFVTGLTDGLAEAAGPEKTTRKPNLETDYNFSDTAH